MNDCKQENRKLDLDIDIEEFFPDSKYYREKPYLVSYAVTTLPESPLRISSEVVYALNKKCALNSIYNKFGKMNNERNTEVMYFVQVIAITSLED